MYTYIFLYTGFILTGSENSTLKFYSKFCRKCYSKKNKSDYFYCSFTCTKNI